MADLKDGCGIFFYCADTSKVLFFTRHEDEVDSTEYSGMVDVLGGDVEDGESPDEAIVREIEDGIRDMRTGLGYELFGHTLFKVYEDPDGRRHHLYAREMDFSLDEVELLKGQQFVMLDIDEADDTDFAFYFQTPITEFYEHMHSKVLA